MIYRNKTDQIQGLTINNRLLHYGAYEHVSDEVFPRCRRYTHVFEPAITLYDHLQTFPNAKVNIGRTFALGDVIMTFVMCRWLSYHYPLATFTLYTKSQFAEIFKVACESVKVHPYMQGGLIPPSDYSINLDGAMELDHSDVRFAKTHRVHIALSILGFPSEEMPRAGLINWNFHLGNAAHVFASKWLSEFRDTMKINCRGHLPIIAIQVRGSHPVKTLTEETLELLIRSVLGYANVILLGTSPQDGIKIIGVQTTVGMSVNQTMAVMRRCSAVICMDSGPLWMAHVVKTPIVLITGPTAPEARIGLFNKTARIRALQCSRWIGCSPCGERGEACNKQYTCIRNVDPAMLCESVYKAIRRVASAPIHDKKMSKKIRTAETTYIERVKSHRLEDLMGVSEKEQPLLLSLRASEFLRKHNYTPVVRHGDFVYDKKGNLFRIEVNMFGMWVLGAAKGGKDDNYHMMHESYTPAAELMETVVFVKNLSYNDLYRLNADRIAANIECVYLTAIFDKVIAARSDPSVKEE